ncbi:MAG TPA: MgtC/SapB family protein, partial [Chloroflexi bacterium]|nr:MgtC/SapB family protein [Chloroflexota bacterium]
MVTDWEMILRMLLAAGLGGLIGWERETQRKPAGFRTLMLVSVSVSLFVIAGTQASLRHGGAFDAVRAMAGIAQGVGFIGAGAIVQAKGEVRWLTTAAALWAAAALGYAAGLGMYVVAAAGGLIVFAILRWLTLVERRRIGPVASRDREKE